MKALLQCCDDFGPLLCTFIVLPLFDIALPVFNWSDDISYVYLILIYLFIS